MYSTNYTLTYVRHGVRAISRWTSMAPLIKKCARLLTLLILICSGFTASSQFTHPGGLHTQADLDRMKNQVAAGAHPWIDGWNALIQDSQAQTSYAAGPLANLGSNRQRASRDAHAAYLNAIRGYISGDMAHVDHAISICNTWSSTVDQVPTGTDIPGLSGIAIAEFAMVGEILRMYVPSRWSTTDFNRFKSMMINYFYPVCHDFLVNHNGRCVDYYWANWDAANVMALVSIGVLCDNQQIFDEGVDYHKNGAGTGSIKNAVTVIHPGNLGQWQEMGRDQSHGFLGVGFMGATCQVAWNQGIDLFAHDSNRLLAGAEYVAQYNLQNTVPYQFYNSCQVVNNKWPSIAGRGVYHDRPIYEMIYNHYVVRRGLTAPNTKLMAEIMRPEYGSADHFGYGTLTFTLNASTLPVHPVTPAPTGLTATAGVEKVFLKWNPASGNTAQGYVVQRATSSNGTYTTILTRTRNTSVDYTDASVTNGTTYYYRVAGINHAGTGSNSSVASATPAAAGALPSGWSKAEIGSHTAGSANYASVSGGTFVVNGYGSTIDGTDDNTTFIYRTVTGNQVITGRISATSGTLSKTGLMIRASLNSNSQTVAMTLGETGWRFARMGYRTTTGGTASSTQGNAYTWQPAWFRIQRSGNTFTAYESSDGVTWFTVNSVTISMPSTYYIGLVACPGSTTAVNTTTFDNVNVTSGAGISGAILQYQFNESSGTTASDASGNGNNGTVNGGATFLAGQGGNAISLDGSNDYVAVPAGLLSSVDDMTIATWVNLDAASTWSRIFDFGTGSTVNMFLTPNSGSVARFALTTSGGGGEQRINSTSALPTGTWTHVAVTLSENTGTLYVNGSVVGTNTNLTLNPSNMGATNNNHIGRSQYSGDPYLDGRIDDFRVYARALSQSEITALVSAGGAGARMAFESGALEETEEGSSFVYPNPTSDEITIALPAGFDGEKVIKLHDENGKVSLARTFSESQHTLNIRNLPSGSYIITVTNNQKLLVRKVIKK